MGRENIMLSVSQEFSTTPGARYRKNGRFSGQEFLQDFLRPKFDAAVKSDVNLIVNLDGTAGYATSFLEEAFGGLARIFPASVVLKTLRLISDDDPDIIEEIQGYISEARN